MFVIFFRARGGLAKDVKNGKLDIQVHCWETNSMCFNYDQRREKKTNYNFAVVLYSLSVFSKFKTQWINCPETCEIDVDIV